jgi:diaminopimelate epimerase
MKKGSITKLAKKSLTKQKAAPKKASARNRQIEWKNQSVDRVTVALEELEIISGELSADLQGLSNVECADSESVDELLEEGNAFEAEVVMGVEDAEDADEVEVRTHEVPRRARRASG